MAIAEDKRRLATRVTAIQVVVFGGLRPARRRLLVLPDRAARQVQGDGREQPPADAAAACAARRHLRSPRPRGGREPQLVQHLDPARTQQGSRAHDRAAGADVTGVPEEEIREIVARHRHEPSVPPDRRHQRRDATIRSAAVMARGLELELPDVVVQEVPTRQYPSESLAAHLIGYVGEANEAQVSEGGFSLGDHRRTDGRREDLQRDADGPGRRAQRRRQQHGPRDQRARTKSSRSKAGASS